MNYGHQLVDQHTLSSMGNAIRQARERMGWSQLELATTLGIKQQSVSKWEAGESRPRSTMLTKISDALDFTADELDVLRSLYYPVGDRTSGTAEPPADDSEPGDDEIEIDYNSAIANMPEDVRQAVIRIVRPYLDEDT